MPVSWVPASAYAKQRGAAQRRIGKRDRKDWPTVALALARSLPIWSQDKDMEESGVQVYTTGELLDGMRSAGGPD
jgi:predicted nucleic acid-binding protein